MRGHKNPQITAILDSYIQTTKKSFHVCLTYSMPDTTSFHVELILGRINIYLHFLSFSHYSNDIMSAMASKITSLTIVYSTFYSGADKKNAPSLAFVRGIHQWPVNSPHEWPVTRKMFRYWYLMTSSCWDGAGQDQFILHWSSRIVHVFSRVFFSTQTQEN